MEQIRYNYRDLLRSELLKRCHHNPHYSVRAFSRDVGLSPGFVSQLLNKRKNLSESRSYQVADALRWEGKTKEVFVTLVRYESARDTKQSSEILRELNSLSMKPGIFFDVSVDTFSYVAEWYHFAIVELAKTPNFVGEARWIAAKLGVPSIEIQDAIERLIRMGLLHRNADGKLIATSKNYSTNEVPGEALKIYHRGMLDKAKAALDSSVRETRNISGMTMAIDPKKLPEAGAMIRKFRRELREFLESGEQSAIYQLSVQLFRLDQEIDQ